LIFDNLCSTTIVARLRVDENDVRDSDFARISPLMFAHIIPNGTYRLTVRWSISIRTNVSHWVRLSRKLTRQPSCGNNIGSFERASIVRRQHWTGLGFARHDPSRSALTIRPSSFVGQVRQTLGEGKLGAVADFDLDADVDVAACSSTGRSGVHRY
jgi:hypothetical protein